MTNAQSLAIIQNMKVHSRVALLHFKGERRERERERERGRERERERERGR